MQKVIAIVGPTAVGKSDISVMVAKKYNGEIISADSRQVYKGLDIGSGKITAEEMQGIVHYCLDIADPKRTTVSAASYQKHAERALKKITAVHKIPVIVGGTGFYIDTLLQGYALPHVAPNKKLRSALATKSTPELYAILLQLDSLRAQTIDKQNPARLIRAIEIADALGSVPLLTATEKYEVLWIGITLPKETLEENIRTRLHKRLKMGMIEEVVHLHKEGVSWKKLESFGLEYRYIAQYLQEKINKEKMELELEQAIFKYAKRQKTWFKKNKEIKWFTPTDIENIETSVKKFLS